MGKKKKHLPPVALDGATEKEVRTAPGIPASYDKYTPSWQFNIIDQDGPYGWNKTDPETIWKVFSEKVKNKEYLNWDELKGSGSHNVSIDKLEKNAQKRLKEIGQNDLDELFSLRLSGTERIWGIRDRYLLKILWWDPNHEVCPSLKKHT